MIVNGYGLGRLPAPDARDHAYLLRATAGIMPHRTKHWPMMAKWLDQGATGKNRIRKPKMRYNRSLQMNHRAVLLTPPARQRELTPMDGNYTATPSYLSGLTYPATKPLPINGRGK